MTVERRGTLCGAAQHSRSHTRKATDFITNPPDTWCMPCQPYTRATPSAAYEAPVKHETQQGDSLYH